MSQCLIDYKSTLIQVMTWCCRAASHYLSQCWPSIMSPFGITRPQRVICSRLSFENLSVNWDIIWTNAGSLLNWHLGTSFTDLYQNENIFMQENVHSNIICKRSAILSQCVTAAWHLGKTSNRRCITWNKFLLLYALMNTSIFIMIK